MGYTWQHMAYYGTFLAPLVLAVSWPSRFPVLVRAEIGIGGIGLLTALYEIWQGKASTATGWLLAAAVAFGFASMSHVSHAGPAVFKGPRKKVVTPPASPRGRTAAPAGRDGMEDLWDGLETQRRLAEERQS